MALPTMLATCWPALAVLSAMRLVTGRSQQLFGTTNGLSLLAAGAPPAAPAERRMLWEAKSLLDKYDELGFTGFDLWQVKGGMISDVAEAKKIANTEYVGDDLSYNYDALDLFYKYDELGFTGFDFWQVKDIFDNIIVTFDVAEAYALFIREVRESQPFYCGGDALARLLSYIRDEKAKIVHRDMGTGLARLRKETACTVCDSEGNLVYRSPWRTTPKEPGSLGVMIFWLVMGVGLIMAFESDLGPGAGISARRRQTGAWRGPFVAGCAAIGYSRDADELFDMLKTENGRSCLYYEGEIKFLAFPKPYLPDFEGFIEEKALQCASQIVAWLKTFNRSKLAPPSLYVPGSVQLEDADAEVQAEQPAPASLGLQETTFEMHDGLEDDNVLEEEMWSLDWAAIKSEKETKHFDLHGGLENVNALEEEPQDDMWDSNWATLGGEGGEQQPPAAAAEAAVTSR